MALPRGEPFAILIPSNCATVGVQSLYEANEAFSIYPNPSQATITILSEKNIIEGDYKITDESGRILGMMPHPERAIAFTHLPNWPLINEQMKRAGRKMPEEGPGLQIFQNGVDYFK